MEQKVLSTQEAAEYLGITGKTLKEWDYKDILKPSFHTDGGHRRYLLNDLNCFLENGQKTKITLDELERKIFNYISFFAKGLIDLIDFMDSSSIKRGRDFPDSWKKASVLMLELSKNHGLDNFEFPLTLPEQYKIWQIPLSTWKIRLFDKLFSETFEEPVLYDGGITDFCKELASQIQERYDKNVSFFEKIIEETRLNNEETEYRNIRKFLIEHPVILKDDLDDSLYLNFQGEAKKYRDKIQELYEDIPLEYTEQGFVIKCPYCGWSLKKTLNKFGGFKGDKDYAYKCNTEKCFLHANKWEPKVKLIAQNCFRVKKGIQEFIVEPGVIELELYTSIIKLVEKSNIDHKCNVILYPECDFADIMIDFLNGEKWAIDAKDWKMPQALAMNLNTKELFFSYNNTKFNKGILVIPPTYGKDYIKILKAYWKDSKHYEIWDSNELINNVAGVLGVEI